MATAADINYSRCDSKLIGVDDFPELIEGHGIIDMSDVFPELIEGRGIASDR
jgi:hypothetical protein